MRVYFEKYCLYNIWRYKSDIYIYIVHIYCKLYTNIFTTLYGCVYLKNAL